MFRFLPPKAPRSKTLEEIRAEVRARHDKIGAEVAARFARGNVAIQEGAFLMEEDLKFRRTKI